MLIGGFTFRVWDLVPKSVPGIWDFFHQGEDYLWKPRKIWGGDFWGWPVGLLQLQLWRRSFWGRPSAPELQTLCGSSADEWQIICRRVADRPRIIRRPNFSLNSFGLHISSSWNASWNLSFKMSFESWDFSAHFSAPEMLGFGCTFFCTETVSFGLQFRCICFSI
jgi:hypothetical protein